jgi:CheY-like chemotaxis protein
MAAPRGDPPDPALVLVTTLRTLLALLVIAAAFAGTGWPPPVRALLLLVALAYLLGPSAWDRWRGPWAAQAAPRPAAPAPAVLVVDDHPTIRAFLRAALAEEGYVVREAGGGVEALALARAERPALIVLDVRMPRMDGRAFARAYHALPGEHAPIVCLTAAARTRAVAAEVGAVAALGKPVDLAELLAVVARFAPVVPAA